MADREPQLAEDPRFTCRREGHKPAITMKWTSVSGMDPPKYVITECVRCGAAIEVGTPYEPETA